MSSDVGCVVVLDTEIFHGNGRFAVIPCLLHMLHFIDIPWRSKERFSIYQFIINSTYTHSIFFFFVYLFHFFDVGNSSASLFTTHKTRSSVSLS